MNHFCLRADDLRVDDLHVGDLPEVCRFAVLGNHGYLRVVDDFRRVAGGFRLLVDVAKVLFSTLFPYVF